LLGKVAARPVQVEMLPEERALRHLTTDREFEELLASARSALSHQMPGARVEAPPRGAAASAGCSALIAARLEPAARACHERHGYGYGYGYGHGRERLTQ